MTTAGCFVCVCAGVRVAAGKPGRSGGRLQDESGLRWWRPWLVLYLMLTPAVLADNLDVIDGKRIIPVLDM
ncbi:Protein of unknown function [Gryllus bimaculatus]|nr:Protein of unknown function [Gryllus bimaculatus]